jgi:hypothetical protein
MISTNPLSKMKFDVPSAAAVTATRRLALQDISLYANNNKAVPSLATSLAGIKGRDDESPVRMEEETSIKAFLPQDHVHEEVRKGNKKREFELVGIGSAALGRKRSRVGDQGIVKPDISWCSKNGSAAFGPKRTRFEDRGTVSPDSVVDRYAATSRGDIGSIGHLPSDCETVSTRSVKARAISCSSILNHHYTHNLFECRTLINFMKMIRLHHLPRPLPLRLLKEH